MEDLNTIENNIVNKPMIIKHQYTSKFQWYHYLIQIIWSLFSLLLGGLSIFLRLTDFSKPGEEDYQNRHKITIAAICFIIALIYTGYVIYKMYKYNSIKDHVAIATPNAYGTRYEFVFLCFSKLLLILWIYLPTPKISCIISNILAILFVIAHISIDTRAMKPMDRYYEHYLSSRKV